jgi:hypothetical protein
VDEQIERSLEVIEVNRQRVDGGFEVVRLVHKSFTTVVKGF